MRIDILLGTYNGELYLADQIESILQQTYHDWRLLIRDDGSTDSTRDIIDRYARKFPSKIFTVCDDKGNIGVVANFALLAALATSEYILFADQDDIWLLDKIQRTLYQMVSAESQYGKHVPVLVHSDLLVANEQLEVIYPSFFHQQKLNPIKTQLNFLLIQNIVTGCTMMINQALLKAALPIPRGAIMHDWWFALVASAVGHIAYINKGTIKYRQHSRNLLGARSPGAVELLKKLVTEYRNKRKCLLAPQTVQAQCLLERLSGKICEEDENMVRGFSNIRKTSFFQKRYFMLKYRIWENRVYRNIYIFSSL